ncbi:MAG: lytic transglycosylase domain-containing protein [Candidatus Aminicenantes bacterium]|nr:lytic transglycosylase domain-containing protein [Candidatus Aminicenantes bacterium]
MKFGNKRLIKNVHFFVCFILLFPFFSFASSNPSQKYSSIIREASQKYNVSEKLIHSIIIVESNYNSRAISAKGAKGLMQLMPDTAEEYGVQNIYDPRQNIEGGVKYLADLISLYKGKLDHILAAYNAGREAVKQHKGVPPYRETKNYIRKVKNLYSGTLSLYADTQIKKYYDKSGRLVLTNYPIHSVKRKK